MTSHSGVQSLVRFFLPAQFVVIRTRLHAFNARGIAMSVIIESQPLQPLEPVLRTWIECVRQYVAVWGGEDLPYWYNEQSNVSVLCGAAWRAGWTALEEY